MTKKRKLEKFEVTVERKMYVSGIVTVSALDETVAIKKVRGKISSGKLQATSVHWDDPQYEDGSFDVTGDASIASDKGKDTSRRCVKHKGGWCACSCDRRPNLEKEFSVRSLCSHFITLPIWVERRIPDCPECLERMKKKVT